MALLKEYLWVSTYPNNWESLSLSPGLVKTQKQVLCLKKLFSPPWIHDLFYYSHPALSVKHNTSIIDT